MATPPSPVYGPVRSWRFGNSLGVDLILHRSTCSFNCIYCQLGEIQDVTMRQAIYVETPAVEAALESVDWPTVDVVTISGSGEPTLALNLGEVIALIRRRWAKPVMVLTNSTWLTDPATRERLREATTVACKLDAPDNATLQRMNRPAPGVTLQSILDGIRALRRSDYPGLLAIQCMFMPTNWREAHALADLLADLAPDEVHLNTPRRPYPRAWYPESRGNHVGNAPVATTALRTITLEQAHEIEEHLRQRLPQTKVISVYGG
jgi:wyosine [tRNA(Phe)-imidazoG37] synthetase (radical SAM superfamily)